MSASRDRGTWAVELHGHGRVGRALVDRTRAAGLELAGVWGRTGRLPGPDDGGRRIFVDATTPRYGGADAEAWLRRLEEVLAGGTPVVTCNKAPLALGWGRLRAAARRGGTRLACSATVGGGTPILLALRRIERTHGIDRVDASLNGTIGYVCDRVAAGASVGTAVAEAVRAGIAEPDPTLDLDGTDSWAKGVILHNLLFPGSPERTLEDGRPRLALREDRIREIAAGGGWPRAVARVAPGVVEVALAPFPPAAARPGAPAPAAARARLRSGGEATVTGPGAGPEVTAGALLGDILEIVAPPSEAGGIFP